MEAQDRFTVSALTHAVGYSQYRVEVGCGNLGSETRPIAAARGLR